MSTIGLELPTLIIACTQIINLLNKKDVNKKAIFEIEKLKHNLEKKQNRISPASFDQVLEYDPKAKLLSKRWGYMKKRSITKRAKRKKKTSLKNKKNLGSRR